MTDETPTRPLRPERWRRAAIAALVAMPLAAVLVAAAALGRAEVGWYLGRVAPALGPGSTVGAAFWAGAFVLFGATTGAALGYLIARRRGRP